MWDRCHNDQDPGEQPLPPDIILGPAGGAVFGCLSPRGFFPRKRSAFTTDRKTLPGFTTPYTTRIVSHLTSTPRLKPSMAPWRNIARRMRWLLFYDHRRLHPMPG
jgi:hypothetical protein